MAENLIILWNRIHSLPFGKKLFSWFLKRTIPYSGSVFPIVDFLDKGEARVYFNDRKKVRNHLNSIHAIALINLGELCSGLAMYSMLSSQYRAIIVQLNIVYLKKARGKITAISTVNENQTQVGEQKIEAKLMNSDSECVAVVTAYWRIGEKPE